MKYGSIKNIKKIESGIKKKTTRLYINTCIGFCRAPVALGSASERETHLNNVGKMFTHQVLSSFSFRGRGVGEGVKVLGCHWSTLNPINFIIS